MRPGAVLWMAGEMGFVHLQDRRRDFGHLTPQHLGDVHGQGALIVVMFVPQRLGEHVEGGDSELQRSGG